MTDSETRVALKTAFEYLRAQSAAVSSLLADVGAIRHSLIEIGPEYKDVLDRHRQKHIEESRAQVYEDLQRLQGIIEKLNGD
jgi:hypothetical protein